MNILQQIAALLGVKLTKVHEKTVANKEAIEAEADRAKGAEETIINNLNSEISRAKAAEKANTDAITAIDEAYQEADTALQTAINNEAAARTAADNSLSARITTEVGERKDADTALDEKKVDKVEGKQLSTEDYTTAEKTKVGNLSSYVVDNIFAKDTGSANLTLNYNTKDPVTGTITKHITLVPTVSSTICGVVSPSQKLVLDNLISGDSALSTLGTPSPTWQLNLGSGPKIKNSGGIFELRNAADNAYADLTVNALTIKGNVTQEGGSFITQAETVSAKDNTILLNSGETGAGVTKGTAGVEIDRGTLPKYKFVFDESDDRFKVGSEGDLWSVMLRDNETDLTDKGILTWDATTKRAKTAFNIDDLADTYLPLAGGTMTGMIKMPSSSSSLLFTGKQVDGSDYKASISFFEPPTPSTPPSLLIGTLVSNARINLSAQGGLFFSDGSIPYKVWHGGNDGADSGLDADLLDGQHGSYYAKATDLGNYIPLAGNSKETPITGHLYTEDVFSWGLYGMKIEGADGLPRTAHIQFNANQTGAMGSEPAKSNAYTEMGSIGEVWGPNTVSQLRVGYEDNLPVLKYRNNPEGPEIKEYNIYHEGNLDVNSMVSGFLPLSGGTMTGNIILPKNVSNNPSLKGLIGEPGWLTQPAGIRGNSILTYHEDNIMLGNDKAILQSISHTSVIVAENELILSAPMIAINTASISCGGEAEIWTSGNDGAGSGLDADLLDGKQGSEYALASSLGSYLPLSAGASHKLTGALWAPIGTPGGASHFNVNVIAGSSTVAHAGIEANANGMAVGFGAHEVGDAYFWIGGNGTQDKDYFAKVNKTSKGMNFLYRPMYNGTNLATVSEIPTNVLKFNGIQSNVNITAGTGTYTFTSAVPGTPNGYAYGSYLQWGNAYDLVPGTNGHWVNQLAGTTEDLLYYRTRTNEGNWSGWKRIAYMQDIPTSLPNPQSITFTGAATGTYNGSSALTINIPTQTSLAWGNITGKPSFATVATSGSYNDLSNKPTIPTSLPANGGHATSFGDGTLKVYAGSNNEINFGGTETGASLYFGYRSMDGRPIPTTYIFGSNNAGTATLYAKNFILDGKQVATTNQIPSIPSSLKNPYAITFTGAVTGTYDGSAAKTVNIPSVPSLSGYATQSWVQSQGYLTSHQSLANYVTLNTTQTISGAKTFTAFVVCSAGSGTSSDIRLKKYINRMFDAEEVLSNLSGYRYVMKETDMHYAGLIAQEVQEVLPEAVREDENGFLTVDTYPIVAALVEANKAKDNRIKALEDRLSTLEKKMSLILNKLGNE